MQCYQHECADKPRYEHDCEACQFIGQDGLFDMYVCAKGNKAPFSRTTLIARFSDEGPDYASGDAVHWLERQRGGDSPFAALHRLAVTLAMKQTGLSSYEQIKDLVDDIAKKHRLEFAGVFAIADVLDGDWDMVTSLSTDDSYLTREFWSTLWVEDFIAGVMWDMVDTIARALETKTTCESGKQEPIYRSPISFPANAMADIRAATGDTKRALKQCIIDALIGKFREPNDFTSAFNDIKAGGVVFSRSPGIEAKHAEARSALGLLPEPSSGSGLRVPVIVKPDSLISPPDKTCSVEEALSAIADYVNKVRRSNPT